MYLLGSVNYDWLVVIVGLLMVIMLLLMIVLLCLFGCDDVFKVSVCLVDMVDIEGS